MLWQIAWENGIKSLKPIMGFFLVNRLIIPLFIEFSSARVRNTDGHVEASERLKALLHYATCVATCLAIVLRHKLQAKLQGVTCLAIIKSRNIFVARSIAQSRIRFYFSQRLPQRCNTFFRHCTV